MNEDEILLKHNFYKKEIEESLNVVKNYIINNKVHITGGMAIDLALKEKNSSIYNEFTIPDYDCYSSKNYEVAKELTEILCKLGYPDVSMMPAIHPTTIRVKVCDYTVFDCTYLPKEILNKVPVLKIHDMIVLHPTFIKIAQYKSMSFLFNTIGEDYNIFYRLKKDYTRNALLNKFYPLKKTNEHPNKENYIHHIPIEILNTKNQSIKIYQRDKLLYKTDDFNDSSIIEYINKEDTFFNTDNSICLGPYLSYLCYLDKLKITNNNIEFESYKDLTPTLISSSLDNINRIKKILNIKPEHYNKIGDFIPEIAKYENIVKLYKIYGERLSCNIKRIGKYNLLICSPCYCMCIFLYYYMIKNDDFYLILYNNIFYLLTDNLKITFSLSTFGSDSYNEVEDYQIKKIKNLTSNLDQPPRFFSNYPNCSTDKEFDYNLSYLYKIDGSKIIEDNSMITGGKPNNYSDYYLDEYPICTNDELVNFNFITRKWVINKTPIIPVMNKYNINYPKITNPDIEIYRKNIYNKLKYSCIFNILSSYNIQLKDKRSIFEIWYWHQQISQKEILDPIIPYLFYEQDKSMITILAQYNISNDCSKKLLDRMSSISTRLCLELNEYIQSYKHKDSYNINLLIRNKYVSINYNDVNLSINLIEFNRLKLLYKGNKFIEDLFCLLLRYEILGNTSIQAALPKNVFITLKKELNIVHECFASPLNAYNNLYCSAFLDTDEMFGSVGSFFNFFPEEGFFEVNPPFNEIIMQKMVEHIEYILINTKKELSFLIVVPKWDDDASAMWQSLSKSRFKKLYFDLDSNDHEYYKGDKFKYSIDLVWTAKHISSVFVLSNVEQKKDIQKIILKSWSIKNNTH